MDGRTDGLTLPSALSPCFAVDKQSDRPGLAEIFASDGVTGSDIIKYLAPSFATILHPANVLLLFEVFNDVTS